MRVVPCLGALVLFLLGFHVSAWSTTPSVALRAGASRQARKELVGARVRCTISLRSSNAGPAPPWEVPFRSHGVTGASGWTLLIVDCVSVLRKHSLLLRNALLCVTQER